MSDGSALEDTPAEERPISVLAIVETLLASCAGLWIWVQWGIYPLLLTSLVMAFLTMLRSRPSVELGARWFEQYNTQKHEIKFASALGIAVFLIACVISYLFHLFLSGVLADLRGVWSGYLIVTLHIFLVVNVFLCCYTGLAGSDEAGGPIFSPTNRLIPFFLCHFLAQASSQASCFAHFS